MSGAVAPPELHCGAHGAAPPPAPGRVTPPRQDLTKGLWRENPVLVQLLGLCPTLAVTNSVANSVVMGLATFFVLVGSSLLVSVFKRLVPNEIRISSYILIIATFVTVADMTLAAAVPAISKSLGPFVPLIVVNCIILGRAEAFAGKVAPRRAAADAIGMGAGFTLALCTISAVRELLGSGTLLGFNVLGAQFEPWVFMVMPPGGFLTLGIIFLVMGWDMSRKAQRAKSPQQA